MRNDRYEIWCPACYKLKLPDEQGGIHCDACVGELCGIVKAYRKIDKWERATT